MEIHASLETAVLQNRLHDLLRRTRIGRTLQHDQLAGPEAQPDTFAGSADVGQVGGTLGIVGRGDADEYGIDVPQHVVIGGGREAAQLDVRSQVVVGHIGDVAPASGDRVHLALVHFYAADAKPGPGERRRQRQADVAQPDDGDVRGVASDSVL